MDLRQACDRITALGRRKPTVLIRQSLMGFARKRAHWAAAGAVADALRPHVRSDDIEWVLDLLLKHSKSDEIKYAISLLRFSMRPPP